LKIEDGTNV